MPLEPAIRLQDSSAIARDLLRHLASLEIRYALLHGFDRLGDGKSHDIDVAVHPADVQRCIDAVREWNGFVLVQVLQYEATGFGLVIARCDAIWEVLTLDVTTDYRWGGRIFLTGSELLAGRHLADGIWRAAADVELAFLLVKKLVEKGDFPVHQRERIEALTRMRGDQSAAVYRDLFGLPAGGEIRTAILAGEWPLVVARTQALARLLRARAAAKHPSRIAGYWGAELGRRVRRLLSPTGVCVALLGPDGAGKSTIAAQLGETTIGPFRRVRRFHFRPRLLAGNTVDNGPGAVREPRGTLASLAKLLLYLVDVWVGYVLVIRPALCRSTLVVFDRYFHDLLVDERRYAYGGPRRLLAWACRLVPAPDLFLFVVADPVQIQERKGELTARQAEGRIVAYLALADEVGGRVIRADTADAAVLEVQRALIATMSDRAGRAAFGHRHARLRRIGRNVQPQA